MVIVLCLVLSFDVSSTFAMPGTEERGCWRLETAAEEAAAEEEATDDSALDVAEVAAEVAGPPFFTAAFR